MKISFTFLLNLLWLIYLNGQQTDKNSKSFTLQGEIVGQDSGKVILSYMPYSKVIHDTAYIKNGEFIFKGFISEPTRALVNISNKLKNMELFLEPGVIRVTLIKDNFKSLKVTGSKTQDEGNELNKKEEPINNRSKILREQLFSIYDSLKNSKNDDRKTLLNKKYEEIDFQLSQSRKELISIQLNFINANPKSFISISNLLILETNEEISLDSLKVIFKRMDKTIRDSKNGKIIMNDIRKKENSSVGAIAPDFTALDLNNNIVTLSQFKGKDVVLIEFWASWCGPCRLSFRNLKTLYQKYRVKGFEIIAVSYMDLDRKTWKSAVNQDSINIWYNVSTVFQNEPGNKEDITENYYIQGIPLTLLIDKSGKIIGRWKNKSEENEIALEKKLAEIFNNENK